jgi:putative DNA primase/helicase
MGAAALRYVRAGWPVFPCREGDGETYDTSKGPKTPRCKQPYVSNGVKAATTDEATITEWWRRWPNAQIGVAMGRNGLFALDFDPRTDEDTGEVWTLERLKTNLEAMLGCAVPISLVAVTPSGGVHVYLKQPHDDAGDIRNRGVLPDHVDVRGRGGYVIAPPSISMGGENASAGRYRWLEGRQGMEPAEAPATLLEILRTPSKTAVVELLRLRGATDALFDQLWTKWPRGAPAPKPIGGERARIVPDANEAVRAYALKALDREIADLRGSVQGSRNNNLNASSYALGQLVGAGALDETLVRTMLESAAREWPDFAKSQGTIESGLAAGIAKPRDLSEIRADAERRLARRGNRLSRSHDDAKPSQSGVTPAGHSGWGEGEPPNLPRT